MAARASVSATPFKGESFPAYVVNRTSAPSRRPSAPSGYLTPSPLLAVREPVGPSTADVVMREISPLSSLMLETRFSVSANMLSTTAWKATPEAKSSLMKAPVRHQRPSLSDQLKTISQEAQSITTQLRSSYQLQAPTLNGSTRTQQHQSSGFGGGMLHGGNCLLEATTIHLSVGRLDCRFPCPVQFGSDRCSYLFQHPFEAKEVGMIMYYRDMRQVQMSTNDRSLRFRVDRVLEQFGDDYRPSNQHHFLKVVFATASEAQKVKQFLSKRRGEFGIATNIDND